MAPGTPLPRRLRIRGACAIPLSSSPPNRGWMFIYESSAISKALAPAPGERGGGVPPGVSREPHRGPGRTREGEGWGRGSGTSPPPSLSSHSKGTLRGMMEQRRKRGMSPVWKPGNTRRIRERKYLRQTNLTSSCNLGQLSGCGSFLIRGT